jgi:N-acetyl-gamma-glutamyl-phosphate reductase
VIKIGLVGARGYVGRELIGELDRDPSFELVFASSRGLAGRKLSETQGLEHLARFGDLQAEDLGPEEIASREADVIVLGLPNGLAEPFTQKLEEKKLIIDLSADNRHKDGWVYGSPELNGAAIPGTNRIANPGCYATAGNLAIWSVHQAIGGPVSVFGVSGFSGAGTSPSPKNDPEILADNVLPYGFGGHVHQGEMAIATGQEVVFAPHVAPFFRGLIATVTIPLKEPMCREELLGLAKANLGTAPHTKVQEELPQLKQAAGTDDCTIGGFAVSADGRHVTISSVLDNLRKGAATQAMENIALALGLT